MFCYQCEQTRRTEDLLGCTLARGTCGKDATVAALQDLLVHQIKGIGQYAKRARELGDGDDEAASFAAFALFTTLTNVNFDTARFVELIAEAERVRDRVRGRVERLIGQQPALPRELAAAAEVPAPSAAGSSTSESPTPGSLSPESLSPASLKPASFSPARDLDALLAQAASLGVLAGLDQVGPDVIGLRALNLYGLKGLCAYAHHAHVLGYRDPAVLADIEDALDFLAEAPSDLGVLLDRALRLGSTNLAVMRLLDAANTGTFGSPTPTSVRTTPVAGKAILVSGHDLPGLLELLKQTAGRGINVYTHGEMLPAHGYPSLKAYPHLVGNYGGAWQDQQSDFTRFPGPIVMTSNCLIRPRPSYQDRIFTNGPVGWPGMRHLPDHDFTTVIETALAEPGFPQTEPEATITVGFGHESLLGVADTVLAAVRSGAIRRFFLIGGCDGAAPGRNYYTEYAERTPPDTVVMTLGCAKYRFNSHPFGEVAGLPRLLDLGQCNDAYSAIQIATALATELGCEVSELPLSLVISWFEQKAVAVLLTLLALGIKNISLGPRLPAFLTPAAVDILTERFGLRTIGDAGPDLERELATAAHH